MLIPRCAATLPGGRLPVMRVRTLVLPGPGIAACAFALVIDRMGYPERLGPDTVQRLRVETGARCVLLFEGEVALEAADRTMRRLTSGGDPDGPAPRPRLLRTPNG